MLCSEKEVYEYLWGKFIYHSRVHSVEQILPGLAALCSFITNTISNVCIASSENLYSLLRMVEYEILKIFRRAYYAKRDFHHNS